ncbi:hypothetical protein [Phycicoccus sp. HDW14]|uniref:hypothetical protein n=1 Tax=Phycicoccus sp. HDW14 TaxID=2714941 RepID=UPI001F0D88F7|nr:hypothetical protein [Phycicoccus sp. HDW14]
MTHPAGATHLPSVILRHTPGNPFETTVEQLATAIRLGVLVDGDQLPPSASSPSSWGSRATPSATPSRRCATPGS